MNDQTKNFLKDQILSEYKRNVTNHSKPYEVIVEGLSFKIIPPHVMSPRYSLASRFMAEVVSETDFSGLDVLDMGTGCGIQGVFAHRNGAKSVLGVDINPYAVKNAAENFKRHDVKGKTLKSDIFDDVPKEQLFDAILFEAPYHNLEPNDWLEYGVADPNYKNLSRFFMEAQTRLRPGGFILLGFSPFYGDSSELEKIIARSPFQTVEKDSLTKQEITWDVTKLKLRN